MALHDGLYDLLLNEGLARSLAARDPISADVLALKGGAAEFLAEVITRQLRGHPRRCGWRRRRQTRASARTGQRLAGDAAPAAQHWRQLGCGYGVCSPLCVSG